MFNTYIDLVGILDEDVCECAITRYYVRYYVTAYLIAVTYY